MQFTKAELLKIHTALIDSSDKAHSYGLSNTEEFDNLFFKIEQELTKK